MAAKISAGILPFRRKEKEMEFFLAHPGGPFFKKRDKGWWTIVKGEIEAGEDPLVTAIREFVEETGIRPEGEFVQLESIVQKAGKTVMCWAIEFDLDETKIVSNTFKMEWPPRSGEFMSFPEVDRAGWFDYKTALELINERQRALLTQLLTQTI